MCESIFTAHDFELKIYQYSINENKDLILSYSIKNNTNECHYIYRDDGWSTIPYVLNLSFLITVNDTVSLHISNPFGGFPSFKADAIMPNDSICGVVEINLNQLYLLNSLIAFNDDMAPYVIKDSDKCSFILTYFDKLNLQKLKFRQKIKTKCVKPITDTLRSNVLLLHNNELILSK
ncbi:MAG: hypothetical protein LBK94_06135 [Prevotellaceae bacterium]|jgi:hypothetical protein|nr:hypothetical protein [Prevotellaceae bacterium]